jgi:hypothetical protein
MQNNIDIDSDFITLKEIKEQFNRKFPNLKIEFFEHEHEVGEASPKQAIFDDSFRLKDVRKEGSMKPISIHGNTKTSSLENHFEEEYGMHVQVYKKRGKTWIQTTSTDDWTLSQQEESTHDIAE